MSASEEEQEKQRRKLQRARELLNYNLSRICTQQEDVLDLRISKRCVGVLSDLVWDHTKNLANDIELFCKHAKRKVVDTTDAELLARKNESLRRKISAFAEELRERDGDDSAERKRKKLKN